VRQQVKRLEHESHPRAPHSCARGIVEAAEIAPFETDAAGLRSVEAGDQVEQRRLARAGLAHHGDVVAGGEL
jgi:hypothetical protein